MTTLLRIDASARTRGSHTRELADHYQCRWQERHASGTVLRRDLAAEPVPHLSDETIAAFHQPIASSATELSDALIRELKNADHLLIASPLYNLTLPSTLKAYFDHIVRAGHTFEAGGDGYRGLLQEKAATVVMARGGSAKDGPDFQTDYLKAILAFVGIESVEIVTLQGTAGAQMTKEQGLAKARQHIDRLFVEEIPPLWQGQLNGVDKEQINALRQAQAEAIVNGDAEAYADLCTDDIQLLVPGHDVISGRDDFLRVEKELLGRASFASFEKFPVRVERSGEVAVEIGRQEATTDRADGAGVYSARQKYTHMLRHTPAGWRFAVLMSNPCE